MSAPPVASDRPDAAPHRLAKVLRFTAGLLASLACAAVGLLVFLSIAVVSSALVRGTGDLSIGILGLVCLLAGPLGATAAVWIAMATSAEDSAAAGARTLAVGATVGAVLLFGFSRLAQPIPGADEWPWGGMLVLAVSVAVGCVTWRRGPKRRHPSPGLPSPRKPHLMR